MVNVSMKVQSTKRLLDKLAKLDQVFSRRAIKKGVSDGTIVILKRTKAELITNKSIDTKTLLKSLGRNVKAYQKGIRVLGVVGARKDAAGKPPKHTRMARKRGALKDTLMVPSRYAHLVEFGTAPHTVGKGDRLARKGKAAIQTGRPHPGARPKPFLRPALEASRTDVQELVIARLNEELINATK